MQPYFLPRWTVRLSDVREIIAAVGINGENSRDDPGNYEKKVFFKTADKQELLRARINSDVSVRTMKV